MNRFAQPASRPSPRRRARRPRPRRRSIGLALILCGFAACLSDEPDEKRDESHAVGAEGDADGVGGDPVAAAVTLPPGSIIDTLPNSGWTEGSFSVSHDGAATYALPLWVPAGRRGHQPTLGLHYSGQAGNGLVGVGWSLSGLSTITPCPRTMGRDSKNQQVSFDSRDAYCLDGMRLRPINQDFEVEKEYRTEKESFSRIVSYVTSGEVNPQPGYFKVWTKDGQILTYGQGGGILVGSRLTGIQPENPALQRDSTGAKVAWALNRIEDRNGNAIDIEYERIETSTNMWSVELRPKAITYGPDRKVEFAYENRPDPIDGFRPSSRGGVHTRVSQRLKTIKMSADMQILREYRLAYRLDTDLTITGRSLLASVKECDGSAASAVCLNALEFEWSGPTSYEFDVIDTDITDVGTPARRSRFRGGRRQRRRSRRHHLRRREPDWKMRYSIGASFGTPHATGIPNFGCSRGRLHSADPDHRLRSRRPHGHLDRGALCGRAQGIRPLPLDRHDLREGRIRGLHQIVPADRGHQPLRLRRLLCRRRWQRAARLPVGRSDQGGRRTGAPVMAAIASTTLAPFRPPTTNGVETPLPADPFDARASDPHHVVRRSRPRSAVLERGKTASTRP